MGEDRKNLLAPYHFFLKPFDPCLNWLEGLGFGKIFGGKDWFRVGVDV
jgi:hypothetical protein